MNALDIKTIKKMMNPGGSMVAFTDDAQSLYDWTGADRVRDAHVRERTLLPPYRCTTLLPRYRC